MEDELKQWANLWQTQDDTFDTMRENFARRNQLKTLKYWGNQATTIFSFAVVLGCGVFLIISGRFPFMLLPAALYLPLGVYMAWRTRYFWRQHRIALPTSPSKYIQSMAHNLAVEQRELEWSNRLAPWLTVFILGVTIIEFIDLGWSKPFLLVFVVNVVSLASLILRPRFFTAPKLKQKTLELRALERSMTGEHGPKEGG